MKYGVEMASGGKKYTPIFIKIGLDVQKLLARIDTHTYTAR
jgi:hypothetical protein